MQRVFTARCAEPNRHRFLFRFGGGLRIVLVTLLLANGCGGADPDAMPEPDNQSGGDATMGSNTGSALAVLISPLSDETPYSNVFDDDRLTEVSGVQRSQLLDGVYYVHNDSGGEPLVYASDGSGQILGTITVAGAEASDWEALTGTLRDGVHNLVIADIGDNDQQRTDVHLLVIEEPQLNELEAGFNVSVVAQRINVSYGDGLSYDAEGLYIEGDNDSVVVLTKDQQETSAQSIWKGSLSSGLRDGNIVLEYSGLVGIASESFNNAITDVDIHPNGREIAVLTYGSLIGQGRIHRWTARDGEGTSDALLRPADNVREVPGFNVQAEGISYSYDGNYLLIGAEGGARSTLTVIAP